MSKPALQPIQLSDAEIRAVYGQGEEAVVTLVKTLLSQIEVLSEQVNQLSVRVETLEGQALPCTHKSGESHFPT
ncbi:hypothetical protein [Alkalinema sp. FACHB-956]|uniref:hypothetical protein n=1 Tax=Alkalinema sp. FACHB-956 TaxID=2692768 RepID=UPI001684B648|nr:hypothetical protein [Alkalinema sp. FACHB-956]MBD2326608.1 hypothetical protein [Alkalinema sp. FACHB-956]